MAIQLSIAARNALLDAIETAAGASAVLRVRTGAQPSSCAAVRAGTVLATLQLPADWAANAASGTKALAGIWQDPVADASGLAGHYEIMDSTLTNCHLQGSCSITAGSGDLKFDNDNFLLGNIINIQSFNLTAPGA